MTWSDSKKYLGTLLLAGSFVIVTYVKRMSILCFYPKGLLNACAAEQERLEGRDASDTDRL